MIATRCAEATFILAGEDKSKSVKVNYSFKYLDIALVGQQLAGVFFGNICKSRQVWGRLGRLLQQKRADSIVLKKFYRAVVKEVLLFGADTWVMTVTTTQKL